MKKTVILLAAAIAASSALVAGCTDSETFNANDNFPSVVRSISDDGNDCPERPENHENDCPDGKGTNGDECPDGNCKAKTPRRERDKKFKDPEGWLKRRRKDKGINPKPPHVPAPVPTPDHGGENS